LGGLLAERARIHYLRGNLCFPRGDMEGCLREHSLSLDLARQAGVAELEAAALGGLSDAEYMRGRMLSANALFRQCVELSERHGFGRIAVANRSMVAATLIYAGDLREVLREALAASEAAAKVVHQRAELIAQMNVYGARLWLGEIDAALENIEAALRLARQIGASRFEAEALAFRGDAHRLAGRRTQALADIEGALVISRKTGMAYMGPWYLGLLAVTTEDAATRASALEEGEALLATNTVGHNHLHFHMYAIDACLACEDWSVAVRHATALEEFTRHEPLPWSSFFAARGRALAACRQGRFNAALKRELRRLKSDAQRFGFMTALPAIQEALDGDGRD
jgi:tetratricopeptide (TPR) repeat protein